MESEKETIEWVCHPARARPRTCMLLSIFLVLLLAGIQWSGREAYLTAFAAVVLWCSLAPFYLPTHYRIAEDTVSIRTAFGGRKKTLSKFRRMQADPRGVLLSPYERPSRLDRFHGLNLRFDSPDRERVTAFIQGRLGTHERSSQPQRPGDPRADRGVDRRTADGGPRDPLP
jgi:hypothetical protein